MTIRKTHGTCPVLAKLSPDTVHRAATAMLSSRLAMRARCDTCVPEHEQSVERVVCGAVGDPSRDRGNLWEAFRALAVGGEAEGPAELDALAAAEGFEVVKPGVWKKTETWPRVP